VRKMPKLKISFTVIRESAGIKRQVGS